jgi:butyryl-CoA dehydrogenase
MGDKFVSERNLKFLLYEVFDAPSLTQYPYFENHSREMFDMLIDTAMKIGKDMLYPALKDMDKNPPKLVGGQVKVHSIIKTFMKECGEGGWISAIAPMDRGGQQLPSLVNLVPNFIFAAANYSASAYLLLSTEAAHIIDAYGSQEMKEKYGEKIMSGEWQGTMVLTEPQAGSSLADIATTAEPTNDGYYKIKGQKIFISASDHDGVENIVNMMLARIKGSPPGVKGISLFIVPKLRTDENGSLVSNDISVSGLYHKMGYRGCPINQLSMGENNDCRGYLLGEPNRGLNYMFMMMNAARLAIGMGAAAIASAAYYASLDYSLERCQGRKMSDNDPNKPQIPIIEHADVKRMLLFQRSVMEGSLSLVAQCYKYSDLTKALTGENKERYELLLDLLTPVAKSYPSEMSVLSVSQGLQILGGYGYCDEFPLEQYLRDTRIHPIHEGTTGIHGITLLGRNVTMKDGRLFELFVDEVETTISAAEPLNALAPYAGELKDQLIKLKEVTSHLVKIGKEETREYFLADATLYLDLFGIIAVAWQWLLQAVSVQRALEDMTGLSEEELNFYQGKMYAFRYFFGYELPKTEGLMKRLMNMDGLTVEMSQGYFAD